MSGHENPGLDFYSYGDERDPWSQNAVSQDAEDMDVLPKGFCSVGIVITEATPIEEDIREELEATQPRRDVVSNTDVCMLMTRCTNAVGHDNRRKRSGLFFL